MKTDRFADSIRRKLESIRPEFTEKDWTRMQSALHQATPPHPGPSVTGGGSMWAGHPWLLAAATVSTVVLMAVSVWQWREINGLRQTVGKFTQQNSSMQPETPAPTGTGLAHKPDPSKNAPVASVLEQAATRPHDTVYVTRRVVVPQQTDAETNTEYSAQQAKLPPEPRFGTETDKPVLANELRSTETKNSNINPTADGTSSTSSIETNGSDLPVITDNNRRETGRKQVEKKRLFTSEKLVADLNLSGSGSTSGLTKDRKKEQRPIASFNPTTDAITPGSQEATAPSSAQSKTTSGLDELAADATRETTAVEQLASLALSKEFINWQSALTKRAKKIRQDQPAVASAPAPATEKSPVSQLVQVVPSFRAGLGTAVSSGVWSAGVFTELLVGQHITLGIGLNKAAYNNTYINDFDFESRTRRDFRREFARGVDPKRDILNIETCVTRLQLPISVGYRIPLNHSFTLTPSISTNLNLSSRESVAFYLPTYGPQRGFEKGKLTFPRSVDLLTNFQLVPTLEWQRGHWVVQGSPVFTIYLQSEPKPTQAIPNWPQTALGLRIRLLYQF